MGTKRSWEGQPLGLHTKSDANMTPPEPGIFQSIFETFRNELDEHHDRRERIIKVSRDITALSKKKLAISRSYIEKYADKLPTQYLRPPTSPRYQRTHPT